MKISDRGDHLIFLVSQPRSGSTLLQRILSNHPQIHTVSEPWIMLHPLYGLKNDGYTAEYDHLLSCLAGKAFLNELPRGINDYQEGLRRMYAYLYNQTLSATKKTYFLDKTPRYYFILSELYHLFPDASFILLIRNPLAVFSSIIRTWTQDNWNSIEQYKDDLLKAPECILRAKNEIPPEQRITISYENLLEDPEKTIQSLCTHIGVSMCSDIIQYGKTKEKKWIYGDQQFLYSHQAPVTENKEKWLKYIGHPQIWRLLYEYLKFLGPDQLQLLGYSYETLHDLLLYQKPNSIRLHLTLSLEDIMTSSQKKTYWRKCKFRWKEWLFDSAKFFS